MPRDPRSELRTPVTSWGPTHDPSAAVARWTHAVGAAAPGPRGLVVVPPNVPSANGRALARRWLGEGRAVRLVIRGATTRHEQAQWEDIGDGDLLLTEVDAYRPTDRSAVEAALLPGLDVWLRATFADVLPGVDGDAFWGSACHRLWLDDLLAALPLAHGLVGAHPGETLACPYPSWIATPLLERLVVDRGGSWEGPPASSGRARFAVTMGAVGTGVLAASLARRSWELWNERPARARVRALREKLGGKPLPTTFLTVVGSFPFSSRHILGALSSETAPAQGPDVGVLLTSTLATGHQVDAFGKKGDHTAIFPVLDEPLLAQRTALVDQVVSYEGVGAMTRGLLTTVPASLRVMGRLMRGGPVVSLGGERGVPLPLQGEIRRLALLATQDVLRGREALWAARKLVERLGGPPPVTAMGHASRITETVVDRVFAMAGATTLDLVHGSLGPPTDHIGSARTFSTKKVFWTRAEEAFLATHRRFLGQEIHGGYPLRPLPEPRGTVAFPSDGKPLRILCLTNYAASWGYDVSRPPQEAYFWAFFEALRAAVPAVRAMGVDVRLAVRTHPADEPVVVEEILRAYADLEPIRANERPLAAELQDAHVVIGSVSTSLVEATMYGVPVFVHDVPVYEADIVLAPFAPQRKFSSPGELKERLLALVAQRARGEEAADAPEVHLRRALFGEAGRPLALAELLSAPSVRDQRDAEALAGGVAPAISSR